MNYDLGIEEFLNQSVHKSAIGKSQVVNLKYSILLLKSKMPEITRLVPKEKKGLIVVITGNGKGKTTSALGIAVRACGHNMRVSIIQFMKGDLYAGEWDGVKKMDCKVELIPTGKGFCGIQGNPYPHEEHRRNAQDAIQLACALDAQERLGDSMQFLCADHGLLEAARLEGLKCKDVSRD